MTPASGPASGREGAGERGIRAGVRRLFRLPLRTPASVRADADEELDAFVDERVAYLVARGLTPDRARAEALRRLGAPLDEVRAALRGSAKRREGRKRLRDRADAVRADVRFAVRQFARARAVTAIALLTLALGIGANAAIFSVAHRLLLAPLPYPNGDRILMPVQEGGFPSVASVGGPLLDAWRARTRTIAAMAGASEDLFGVRPDGAVDTIPSATVTANLLPMLGVRPALGRNLVAADEQPEPEAASVAMISYGLWQRAYGGRADAVGATVRVEGRPLTVVGVTPSGFNIPLSRNPAPDVWVPTRLERAVAGGSGDLIPGPGLFVTLRPGATAEAASRELRASARALPAADASRPQFHPAGGGTPAGAAPPGVRVLRPQDFLGARETRAVQVLFAAVGALLLIACANVANLLLARAWTRRREFAVRGALGAGRGRLARQVLTESVLLALGGGALGVGVAWLALRVIVALRPPELDHLAGVHVEPSVLLWSLGISVATGILFGSAPALVAGARTVGEVLRRETRGGSAGVAARRVRSALVVAEVALALVLLVASGLLVRSFTALQRMPLGFEPRGLVYAEVLLGGRRNRDREPALRDAIVRRLRALPGVTGVGMGIIPGKGLVVIGGVEAEADREGHTTRLPQLSTIFFTPEYLRVARIALVEGRLPDTSFTTSASEAIGLSPEVVVSRRFARRAWPNGNVLGARVRPPVDGQFVQRAAPWSTVVGVVDDTRMPEVQGGEAVPHVYSVLPPRFGDLPIVVRTSTSGDVAAPRVKRAIASVDPTIYVRQVLSGDTYLRDALAPTRFATSLLTAFGALALVLAAVGLYGVIAYGVSQRTREIGVRLALGAPPGAVVRRIAAGGLRLAGAGVLVGTAAAAAATGVLRGMLYAVGPADPLTFAVIALLVTGIALVASYVPARRALRVDPAETLRAE